MQLSCSHGAFEAAFVEPQRRVIDALDGLQRGHDLLGIGCAGHAAGAGERGRLDVLHARSRQGVD
jgi:hypothetical protein